LSFSVFFHEKLVLKTKTFALFSFFYLSLSLFDLIKLSIRDTDIVFFTSFTEQKDRTKGQKYEKTKTKKRQYSFRRKQNVKRGLTN